MKQFQPRRFAAVAAGLALAGTLAATAWAAPPQSGSLDPSFNGTGYTTTPIGGFSFAQGVTTQGDKTIAVGGAFNATDDFAIARYNKNGSLDTSFGSGGITTVDFNGGDDQATSVAMQGDKTVVAGFTTPDGGTTEEIALARLNKDGSLDTSFGTGGEVVTNFGDGYDFADAVAVKGDSIVIAGETRAGGPGDDNFLVAQYKKNGQLDTSFGTGGFTATDFNGDFDAANGLAFQGDKIVLAGYVSSAANGFDFGLARYTKNGQLDTSFGTGGKVETDFFGGNDAAHAVDVKGDSIVAVGDVVNGTQVVGPSTNTLFDFAAAMYDKNGHLDPKFGNGGKAVLSAGDVDQGYTGGFGPGDSVWVGGTTEDYVDLNTAYFAVGRWTKNGTPDPKFGTNGTTRNTMGGDSASAIGGTVGPGDTITLAGIDIDQGDFALARYIDKG
ncbi:MAG TPA: hypothetical protein VLJ76_06765 [Gaiellaceae bacterium]|nr:hypothetical protein [Gaiellaceae bacterium]